MGWMKEARKCLLDECPLSGHRNGVVMCPPEGWFIQLVLPQQVKPPLGCVLLLAFCNENLVSRKIINTALALLLIYHLSLAPVMLPPVLLAQGWVGWGGGFRPGSQTSWSCRRSRYTGKKGRGRWGPLSPVLIQASRICSLPA